MTNPNQELLDWAVKNVKEWNDEYDRILSDDSSKPVHFAIGSWYKGINIWINISGKLSRVLSQDFRTSSPQVITKQEWLDAKKEKNMNEFKIEDLKTGMRVTLSDGRQGIVYRNVAHNYHSDGDNRDFIAYTTNSSWEFFDKVFNNSNIEKVEVVGSPYFYSKEFNGDSAMYKWKTIWEKSVLSPEQKEFRELKAQSEELLKKQQELNEKIAKLESK